MSNDDVPTFDLSWVMEKNESFVLRFTIFNFLGSAKVIKNSINKYDIFINEVLKISNLDDLKNSLGFVTDVIAVSILKFQVMNNLLDTNNSKRFFMKDNDIILFEQYCDEIINRNKHLLSVEETQNNNLKN